MTQLARIGTDEEMTSFHQHVGRDGHLHAVLLRQQSAIIPYAQRCSVFRVARAHEVARNEIEFGQHAVIVQNAVPLFAWQCI